MNETSQPSATDIPDGSWIDLWAPQAARPYLRLARMDRPIGTWLLLLPCWWGVTLAGRGQAEYWVLALFAIGSLVMRGAGCTINDIADRDIDGRVARTATRPIASGEISVPAALVFLAAQLLVGLAILVQFNTFTIVLGISSLVLVAAYPFMKRITYWPQLFLGLTFNWGALVGWAAVHGELSLQPVLLYAAAVFWTLGYDTIYAHQDKEDDVLVGVKSTAIRFGRRTKPWLWLFYALTVALLGAAGWTAQLGWPYFLALAAGAAQMVWQIISLDIDNPSNCLRRFKSNRDFGLIILFGIILSTFSGT